MGTLWTQDKMIEGFPIIRLPAPNKYVTIPFPEFALDFAFMGYSTLFLGKSTFLLFRNFLCMIYQCPRKKCAASEFHRLFAESLFRQQSMIASEIILFNWKTTLSL